MNTTWINVNEYVDGVLNIVNQYQGCIQSIQQTKYKYKTS